MSVQCERGLNMAGQPSGGGQVSGGPPSPPAWQPDLDSLPQTPQGRFRYTLSLPSPLKPPAKHDGGTNMDTYKNQIAPTHKYPQDACPPNSPVLRDPSKMGTDVPTLETSPGPLHSDGHSAEHESTMIPISPQDIPLNSAHIHQVN